MELNIGEVITAKRKEKSWTQEQLANAVGVSTPAVSKWETGTTYPDITLLSPIARALNTTVDELFSYQNELSSDDVSELTKKAARTYETDGFESGWNYCQNLLQEYPNSIPLKFYLGNLFQSFMLLTYLMKPNIAQQEIQSYYRQSTKIYEEVLSSGHPKFSYPATIILIGFYAMLNELDRAQELLDSLPKAKVDPDLLYPSIHTLRGEHDEAMKLTQENIRRYVPRISQSLGVLCAYARERDDMDTAYTLAKINFEMTKLFGIKEEIAYPDIIKILASRGDKQNALNYLEAYAESILELSYDYSNNPVFNRLLEEPKDTSYIKKILAQSILIDKEYASLKDKPRYIQIVEKLHKITEAPTNTFRE
ncbi:MAG: helix-turn-helix transcriptional regulator [Clostridiales bacterium]